MKDSKISWTTHTFNPWLGCAPVSAGCHNCYAAKQAARYSESGPDVFRGTAELRGAGDNRRAVFNGTVNRTSETYWRQPRTWNRQAEASGVRPRVFCASMADWLHEAAPLEWLADLLSLVRETPALDWLLLTKRPEAWASRIAELAQFRDIGSEQFLWELDWYAGIRKPGNVWVGTTVEDQQAADTRIPHLLKIPAAVRFLSCEPLLSAVALTKVGDGDELGVTYDALRGGLNANMEFGGPSVDWAIVGGESGPRCRPMDPDWARAIIADCRAAGVPVFVKQLGGHPHKRGELGDMPDDLRVREFPVHGRSTAGVNARQ